jgi:hypothetical protein
MKTVLFIASICCAFFLVGCADNLSLQSDEDYKATHGPAPHSPDFSAKQYGY